MPVAGPFYFAWVDETETTFGSVHHRMDEYIFSARRVLAEGEKPKLELVIENPRVGLLSAQRKQWCWFAWRSNNLRAGGGIVVPLFFGRVVGTPSDLQSETITITFIAWPSNYKKQLQRVAEALKIPPFYDQVFIDVSRRDDPMTIFESQSKLVCVDPITHVVSASDILDAEDGNVDFTADDHFYDSVHIGPGAVPKTTIHVDATVSWTQEARGYVDMGSNLFSSYSGDGILSEWPKPLTSIAPGLTVFTSTAYDVNGTANIFNISGGFSFHDRSKRHEDGDTISFSSSWTVPAIHGQFVERLMTMNNQPGFLDPYAVDENGDPSPINIPMSINETFAYVPVWTISTSMVLEYQAARQHTERVIFNLFADVQATVLDPGVSEDGETLNISGSDVGVPIIQLLNWTTVSGTFVAVGTVIFPDDPQLPGNNTAQVVVVAGVTGDTEPNFSDVTGETTVDGTATWASLGVATPTDNAPDWTGISNVPTGSMILPHRPVFTTYAAFVAAGLAQFPPVGTPISEGTILQTGSTFVVCTQSGTIEGPGADTAVLTPLSSLPDGKTYFIAVVGGVTGAQYVIPNFDNTLYADTIDGSVTWKAVGQGDIPIGGTPGNVMASTYFASDRGRVSIQHLICRARARLRYASRCVTTQFQCAYGRGTELTLRKSVTLHDYRLPGGLVLGKITGVEMVADGGAFICNVTIQSAVGLGTVLDAIPGDATYVADGFVVTEYLIRSGEVIVLSGSDVGFTPLLPVSDEDGITFPLQKEMIIVSAGFKGGSQDDAVSDGLDAMFSAANPSAGGLDAEDLPGSEDRERRLALLRANSVSEQLRRVPNWYELVLKPLNGRGSFNHVYHLTCTLLALPKMIDLQDGTNTSSSGVGGGVGVGGELNLHPSLVDITDMFHHPVITGGAFGYVYPNLINIADTIYSPTLTGGLSGGRTLFPSRVTIPDVILHPSVAGGGSVTSAGQITLEVAEQQNNFGFSEGLPKDVPESYSWYGGYDGGGDDAPPPGITAMTGWGVVYQMKDTSDAVIPGLIEVRNMRSHVRLIADKSWVQVQDETSLSGGHYVGDFAGDAAINMDIQDAGGGIWTMDGPPRGYNNHWFMDPRGSYADGTVDAAICFFEIRVTDVAAENRLVAQSGVDWWRTVDAPYVEPVGTNNPAAGGSNWITVTTEWKAVCCITIPNAELEESLPPGVIP